MEMGGKAKKSSDTGHGQNSALLLRTGLEARAGGRPVGAAVRPVVAVHSAASRGMADHQRAQAAVHSPAEWHPNQCNYPEQEWGRV